MSEIPPQQGFFGTPPGTEQAGGQDQSLENGWGTSPGRQYGDPPPPGQYQQPPYGPPQQPPYGPPQQPPYGPPQQLHHAPSSGGGRTWLKAMIYLGGGILFLGVMMAIATPVIKNARSEAYRASCQSNLRTIDAAIMTYEAVNYEYPRSMDDLVPYLEEELVCPEDGSEYVWVDNGPYVRPTVKCPNGHSYGP